MLHRQAVNNPAAQQSRAAVFCDRGGAMELWQHLAAMAAMAAMLHDLDDLDDNLMIVIILMFEFATSHF